MSTLTLIVRLIQRGRLVRHDGTYENHYPARRDRFLRLVAQRAAEMRRGL